jgi:hypothetical protein
LKHWPFLISPGGKPEKTSRVCDKFKSANPKQPLKPHEVPKLPFEKIAGHILDFGHVPYLVLVDYFSKWVELCPLKNKMAGSIINALQSVFSTHGLPRIFMADNMPFSSFELRKYFRDREIELKTSSPHYPRSNGMAEKAVHIDKQILQKRKEPGADFRDLLREYRATPLKGLNASPAQILFSRQQHTRLPAT